MRCAGRSARGVDRDGACPRWKLCRPRKRAFDTARASPIRRARAALLLSASRSGRHRYRKVRKAPLAVARNTFRKMNIARSKGRTINRRRFFRLWTRKSRWRSLEGVGVLESMRRYKSRSTEVVTNGGRGGGAAGSSGLKARARTSCAGHRARRPRCRRGCFSARPLRRPAAAGGTALKRERFITRGLACPGPLCYARPGSPGIPRSSPRRARRAP